jgi:hypothetical protein
LIFVALMVSQPNACWDFDTLSDSTTVSVRERIQTPHLPWKPIQVENVEDLPPLHLILASTDVKWSWESLLLVWTWDVIFSLPQAPWPDFVDWTVLSTRAAKEIRIVDQHVRSHPFLLYCDDRVQSETRLGSTKFFRTKLRFPLFEPTPTFVHLLARLALLTWCSWVGTFASSPTESLHQALLSDW